MNRNFVVLVPVSMALVLGCANAAPYAGSPCARASEHLRGCLGSAVDLGPSCDEASALAVLEQPCADLRDPGKADLFDGMLCRLGYYHRCPQPTCGLAEGAPFQTCSEYIDAGGCTSCDYYLCRDARRDEPCGPSGYYLGFVRRYCQLFTERTAPALSEAGQQWIADVRPCLQQAMESVPDDASCEEVRRIGYEAHPGCYIDTGFCELPITDMLAILKTVAPNDLGSQPITTALGCIDRFFHPDTGELTDEGAEELERELSEP
ncbi:MAG: hypothetical protein ACK6CU_20665 [Deltaproteobacteria bacterium]